MNKTYKFPEELLSRLAMIIGSQASNIESAQRWNEDREDSFEWRRIADIVSHLAWCPFRKQLSNGKAVEVTLETKAWKDIKEILKTQFKQQIHPLYTKIYPEQIAKLKKAKVVDNKLIEEMETKIVDEQNRVEKKRELIAQILEIFVANKEK